MLDKAKSKDNETSFGYCDTMLLGVRQGCKERRE